jgi:hypothetical protein
MLTPSIAVMCICWQTLKLILAADMARRRQQLIAEEGTCASDAIAVSTFAEQ